MARSLASPQHIESQLIEHFKRIYHSAKRVAKLVAISEVVDERVVQTVEAS